MPRSNTTPSLPSVEDRFADAEAAHAVAAEENAAVIAGANVALSAAEQAIEDATDHLSDVQAALVRGTDEFTGTDLANAKGDLEAAELALAGTRSRIQRARRLPVNTSTEAALALVPVMQHALPGVPIVVTAVTKLPELTEADAPLCVIQQTEDTQLDDGTQYVYRGKTYQGVKVKIHYCRGQIHRDLDAGRIDAAIRQMPMHFGARREFAGSSTQLGSNSAAIDYAQISTRESAPVPAVPGFVADYGAAVSKRVETVIAASLSPRWKHETTTVRAADNLVVDGIRTTVVRGLTTLIEPVTRNYDRPQAGAGLADLMGQLVSGVGRVVAVDQERDGDRTNWTVQLTSRESHEVPHPAPTDDAADAA